MYKNILYYVYKISLYNISYLIIICAHIVRLNCKQKSFLLKLSYIGFHSKSIKLTIFKNTQKNWNLHFHFFSSIILSKLNFFHTHSAQLLCPSKNYQTLKKGLQQFKTIYGQISESAHLHGGFFWEAHDKSPNYLSCFSRKNFTS